MIPFQLHRRIPLIRRPFHQRDQARAECDALRSELDSACAELQRVSDSYHRSRVFNRPVEHTSGSAGTADVLEAVDTALAVRISAAYRSANATSFGEKNSFWLTEFAKIKQSEHDLLTTGNPDAVAALLRNPRLSKLFVGFDELHDPAGVPAHGISHVISSHAWIYDLLMRFAEAIGARRLYYPEEFAPDKPPPEVETILLTLDDALGFHVTFPNPFPGETGLATSRGVASFRGIQSLHQAWRIFELAGKNTQRRVLEIGGGLGRTAFYAAQFGFRDYTLIDLPLTNAAQGYFLGRTLGVDAVTLYQEQCTGIRILPPAGFLDANDRYDIVINADSLTEMAPETAKAYCEAIRSRAGIFLSINHEFNPFTVREICRELNIFADTRMPYWLRRGYLDEVFNFSA